VPGSTTSTDLILPAPIYALAFAPVPPPPTNVIVGVEVYPSPASNMLTAVSLKPTLSFQFLSGYSSNLSS